MTDKPVKEAIRAHIEEVRLSDDQWQQLAAMMAEADKAPPSTPEAANRPRSRPVARWIAAVAAAALILLVAGLSWFGPWWAAPDLVHDIAHDVAKHHGNLKPLEIESGDMASVGAHFDALPFQPFDSGRTDGLDLMGGRYCSILGEKAAQLRFEDGAGSPQSLYMAPYDPEHFGPLPNVDAGAEPLVVQAGEVDVRIWVERDVIMALTETP